jgi:hypothetical protein
MREIENYPVKLARVVARTKSLGEVGCVHTVEDCCAGRLGLDEIVLGRLILAQYLRRRVVRREREACALAAAVLNQTVRKRKIAVPDDQDLLVARVGRHAAAAIARAADHRAARARGNAWACTGRPCKCRQTCRGMPLSSMPRVYAGLELLGPRLPGADRGVRQGAARSRVARAGTHARTHRRTHSRTQTQTHSLHTHARTHTQRHTQTHVHTHARTPTHLLSLAHPPAARAGRVSTRDSTREGGPCQYP